MAFSSLRFAIYGKQLFHYSPGKLYNSVYRGFRSNLFQQKSKSLFYLCLFGLGTGAIVGGGYSYKQFIESQKPISITEQKVPILDEIPEIKVSRTVSYPNYKSDLRVSLFHYANCPFCYKVQAFLDYYGISYDLIDVDPVLRKKIKWSYQKNAPIVVVQEKDKYAQLKDSGLIISALASYFMDNQSTFFDILQNYRFMTFKEKGTMKTEVLNQYFLMIKKDNLNVKHVMLEARWRTWANESLLPILLLNVYRTPSEALKTFQWFSDTDEWNKSFPALERITFTYLGSLAMWLMSKNLQKQHDIKDDAREALYDECKTWLNAIQQQGNEFLGGDNPNLADIEVYGVLSSIEGSKAFDDVVKNTDLEKWYWAVHMHVKKNKGREFLQR